MFNNYLTNVLAATSSTIGKEEVEVVQELAKTSNTYGFMTLFSVIILVLIVVFFITYQRTLSKRQSSELKILEKERETSLNQSDKMYDLFINVQTEQVVHLRKMTDVLEHLYDKSVENRDKLSDIDMTVHKMDDSIKGIVNENDTILKTLSEILVYMKTIELSNKEILDKVGKMTEYLRYSNSKEENEEIG